VRKRSRIAGLGAGVLAGVLALSACAPQLAGSAAVIGDDRITDTALADMVAEALTEQDMPTDSPDADLTATTLSRMIIFDLVDILAERSGVVVTSGEVDVQRQAAIAEAGDTTAMEQQYIDQGIPTSMIDRIITLNLQASKIGPIIDPDGAAEEQAQAVFDAAVALSKELDVRTAPRYGTWDSDALRVGPISDALASTPSVPSPSDSSLTP
jgi:hypothetical protein